MRNACAAVLLASLAACAPASRTYYSPAPGDSLRSEIVAPGVTHTYRWEAAGPWAIHVTEADMSRCGLALRTVKAMDRIAGRETTSQLAAHLGARSGRPVIAAVNADFFTLRNPQGVPLGPQVVDGEPLRIGTGRPAFGVTENGQTWFGVDQGMGIITSARGAKYALARVDERPTPDGISLYNRYAGSETPTDTAVVELMIRVTRRGRSLGDTVTAIVEAIDTVSAGLPIGPLHAVLAGRGRGAEYLRSGFTPGDTVRWTIRFANAPAPITEMTAGNVQLMRDGRSLGPFTGGADTLRHPRTAVGITRAGHALLVTVDGRQAGYSAGMTLAELTAVMTKLGASDALNLDGGGSTAMVLNGRVVNRPSDATGERPVANALALVGPTPGTCR